MNSDLRIYFGDSETIDIAAMHRKFNMRCSLYPCLPASSVLVARAKFIQEELNELKDAIITNDHENIIDALIDIVVVVKGTAVILGIRWDRHWDEVHEANMRKERGHNPKRLGLEEDLVKPPGWKAPDHLRVITEYHK